jgi:hypothetical protein
MSGAKITQRKPTEPYGEVTSHSTTPSVTTLTPFYSTLNPANFSSTEEFLVSEYFFRPTFSLMKSSTVSCHSIEFSAFRTQWFSSGKVRNWLSTPRDWSVWKAERPSEMVRR